MAGKVKPMSQIKQLLQLKKQEKSRKYIARTLGISRNTVKAYLTKIYDLKMSIDDLLALEDPVLESKFHAGNPAYKEVRFEDFKSQLPYYEKELKKRKGVTRKLLWEEYDQANTNGYRYTQFCYHLKQQMVARKPSAVLIHNPAEKIFVDFAGAKLPLIDRDTGEVIWCPVFVACLPYSDYGFAMAVRTQGIEDFIYALRCCLEFFGGSPQILVPDNLKTAVIKANRYAPEITRALEDFCNFYNITVIPARVVSPKDKALVENQVKLVYNRVYAKLRNNQFFSLFDLNKAIREKIIQHNQTRMQQKPYCREERFLANEKHLLQPLPTEPYEIKYYKDLKVAKNNHILLTKDMHYYSVPYKWIGEKVRVIYTRTIVRIYARGEKIAVHNRNYARGDYSTIRDHLCSHHQAYRDRSPAKYLNMAQTKSPLLYQIINGLFEGGRPPEQNYKSCDGLFSLYRKTEPEIFNRACKEAIECGSYSYQFVLKIIENLKSQPQEEKKPSPLPEHGNIRGKEYYQQLNLKF
jgi:transposase